METSAQAISSFIADLRKVRDDTMRNMMRFQLEIGNRLVAQIQNNIKSTFGQSGRSEITEWASGNTARSSGRGGGLFESVKLDRNSDGNLTVNIGGVGVPYAGIQEYGGVITPRNSKYLTIPSAKYANHRAREFDLVFGMDPKWGKVLLERGTTNVAFLLRSRVTIPARPYIQPAIDKMSDENGIRLALAKSFTSPEVIIQ